MDLRTVFDRLGMPTHSGALYQALEKKGPATLALAAREAGIHRPQAYRAAQALLKAGLVRKEQRGKRSLYVAAKRSRIKELFAETFTMIRAIEKGRPKDRRDEVRGIKYFEGPEGVAAVFNDVIAHTKRGETFYRYTSEKDLDEVNQLLPADYRKRRDAKKLERLVISNWSSGSRKRSRLERFIKYLGGEREAFKQNAIQLVYGERIAFIDLNTWRSVVIENPTLANFQKTIFRALYDRL